MRNRWFSTRKYSNVKMTKMSFRLRFVFYNPSGMFFFFLQLNRRSCWTTTYTWTSDKKSVGSIIYIYIPCVLFYALESPRINCVCFRSVYNMLLNLYRDRLQIIKLRYGDGWFNSKDITNKSFRWNSFGKLDIT